MKLLSQQIRELVEQAPTSSYAIAREAGIDKSAMSRFMNGGRLTMDKLDQLAGVLGVRVTTEISTVPRPLPKGRPSTKVRKQVKKMQKRDAERCAKRYAKEAHQCGGSPRGIWYLDEEDCLLLYSDDPYYNWVNGFQWQNAELGRIEKRLKKIAIDVLASASENLRTRTLLLNCSKDRLSEVRAIVEEEADRTFAELTAK